MKFAVDTNVLAYAEGADGPERRQLALDLLERLPPEYTGVPVQALGELFRVLVGKMGRSPAEARAAVLHWGDTFPLLETSGAVLLGAADLVSCHRDSRHNSRAGHPGWRRCSLLT